MNHLQQAQRIAHRVFSEKDREVVDGCVDGQIEKMLLALEDVVLKRGTD
jgi:hypothetical protein